jgi:hypothetical protein
LFPDESDKGDKLTAGASSEQFNVAAPPSALRLTGEDYSSPQQQQQQQQHVDEASQSSFSDAAALNLAERSPRFEDPSGHANVTVQLGDTAFLNCRVLDLQDKTVRLYPRCPIIYTAAPVSK